MVFPHAGNNSPCFIPFHPPAHALATSGSPVLGSCLNSHGEAEFLLTPGLVLHDYSDRGRLHRILSLLAHYWALSHLPFVRSRDIVLFGVLIDLAASSSSALSTNHNPVDLSLSAKLQHI